MPTGLGRHPDTWSFAIYEYSGDRYADCMFPGGGLTGTPEAGLDCACVLYLNDPSACFEPRGTDAVLH